MVYKHTQAHESCSENAFQKNKNIRKQKLQQIVFYLIVDSV